MGSPPRHHVHVDAVVEKDGLTCISVVQNGEEARPITSRIMRTSGSVEAEMRAVLLAMQYAERARWENVRFHCDANGIVRMIDGVASCRPEYMRPLRDRAQEFMVAHPGWEVVWVKRTFNSSAHVMASQTLRAYKHGREHGRLGIKPRSFLDPHTPERRAGYASDGVHVRP